MGEMSFLIGLRGFAVHKKVMQKHMCEVESTTLLLDGKVVKAIIEIVVLYYRWYILLPNCTISPRNSHIAGRCGALKITGNINHPNFYIYFINMF
jgi:hypothetical protein